MKEWENKGRKKKETDDRKSAGQATRKEEMRLNEKRDGRKGRMKGNEKRGEGRQKRNKEDERKRTKAAGGRKEETRRGASVTQREAQQVETTSNTVLITFRSFFIPPTCRHAESWPEKKQETRRGEKKKMKTKRRHR